jgi:hypothetical protein
VNTPHKGDDDDDDDNNNNINCVNSLLIFVLRVEDILLWKLRYVFSNKVVVLDSYLD